MKRMFLAAAALLVTGAAQADPFANMYGNTVNITEPDGKTKKIYVNQDMTWEQDMDDGTVMKGTFSFKDANTVCFTNTDPPPKPDEKPACAKQDEHKVGDTWTKTNNKNETWTYSLTAGR